jgi:SAM-dependent methyltransferase
MSTLRKPEKRAAAADPPPVYFDARSELAARFLFGEGLEIGPLHLPLTMPPQARVRYVDRMPVERLREEYPELADWELTPVDVVDDGERLATIPEASQDFIVANHFLEHCEDPIRTIETHLGKLRPGGVLFYAVPDKRYTFDFRRSVTPLEHFEADYEEGPERSRREHYDEWARLVLAEEAGSEDEDRLGVARRLEDERYSIHMHAWAQAEFLRLVLACRDRFEEAFDIEAAARQGIEFVVVLRKQGESPNAPPPLNQPVPDSAEIEARARLRARVRRALGAARRELRRPK